MAFMPSLERSYSVWYKGRYMTVTRSQSREPLTIRWRPVEYIGIRYALAHPSARCDSCVPCGSMLTRNSRLLRDLLIEARNTYKVASKHLISVHVAQRWVHHYSRCSLCSMH